MFYIHFSPNLKTPAITFINERTTWYCLRMLMLLSTKISFTGCYFVKFTSVVLCDMPYVFIIPLYACEYGICLIKVLTYLDLLTSLTVRGTHAHIR